MKISLSLREKLLGALLLAVSAVVGGALVDMSQYDTPPTAILGDQVPAVD